MQVNTPDNTKIVLVPYDANYEEVYIGGNLGNKNDSGIYFKRGSTNGGDIILYNDTSVSINVWAKMTSC